MMKTTLKTLYERGYIGYSLIPFVALWLVIAHQIYMNIPVEDDRPFFTIGGVSQGRVGELGVVFSIEDSNRRVMDEFVLEFALKNYGESDYVQRIRLPLFEIKIHDENGIQIASWSDGRRFRENFFLISLTPGDEFTETKAWDLKVYNSTSGEMEPLGVGRYWLSGVWLGNPVIESGKILLTIG